jgi:hypothetical protein
VSAGFARTRVFVAAGAFVFSGRTIGILAARRAAAAAGGIGVAGQAAEFSSAAADLSAAPGAVAVLGWDVQFARLRKLTAATGTLHVTGHSASIAAAGSAPRTLTSLSLGLGF